MAGRSSLRPLFRPRHRLACHLSTTGSRSRPGIGQTFNWLHCSNMLRRLLFGVVSSQTTGCHFKGLSKILTSKRSAQCIVLDACPSFIPSAPNQAAPAPVSNRQARHVYTHFLILGNTIFVPRKMSKPICLCMAHWDGQTKHVAN